MNEGFMCVSTLDRFDELRRFLTSFKAHNSLPIQVIIATNIENAHRIKTLCAFFSPFENTVFLDTDMLVNGNLYELFDTAKGQRIGIVREKGVKVLNSGMLVFPKDLMMKVCRIWNEAYIKKIDKGFDGTHGTWDQDILNFLLQNRSGKYPFVELPSKWNHIVKDYPPLKEMAVYNDVKIFHFLHAPDIDRTKYKSYQTFMEL